MTSILQVTGMRVSRHDPISRTNFHLELPWFDAPSGARIGIIGSSGSGKTTLLEALGLLSWPAMVSKFLVAPNPNVSVVDLAPALRAKSVNALASFRATNIGFVVQDGGLLPFLTILQNAQLASRLAGLADTASHDRIIALADAIGIAELLHRYPAMLSGGQRQRAAVLRALATGAALVIGDEITAALDPNTSDEVMNLLTWTADQLGATLILASHNRLLL
jgi:putative ABC transport system ATP-binding protein